MRFAQLWVVVVACSGSRTEVAPPAVPARDAGVREVSRDARSDAAIAMPAGPLDVPIAEVQVQGSRLVIAVAIGSDAGVTGAWHAELIDAWDRPLPGTRAPLLRVTARAAYFAVAGTHVPTTVHVRLYPPVP